MEGHGDFAVVLVALFLLWGACSRLFLWPHIEKKPLAVRVLVYVGVNVVAPYFVATALAVLAVGSAWHATY